MLCLVEVYAHGVTQKAECIRCPFHGDCDKECEKDEKGDKDESKVQHYCSGL